MATDTINLPKGFVLDKPAPNAPSGFVIDQSSLPAEAVPEAEQQANELRTQELFSQLGGRVPTSDPLKKPPPFDPLTPGSLVPTQVAAQERRRRGAFNELIQTGKTPGQIDLTLKTQNLIDRPRVGRTVGGIAGALGATAIAGRLIPGPFDDLGILAAFIAAGGAGVGGVAGEATQIGIEEKRFLDKREALKAFATETSFELGGRGVVRAGKFLLSPLIKKIVPEAAALVDDFAKVGGSFSPSELDSRFSIRIAEGFSRGGFGAKEIFQEFEEKQGRAVLAFADNIIESIGAGVARQTPKEIGEIFASGITRPNGRVFNLLDDLFDPLFKQVDDLARESTKGFRQVRAGGKAIRGQTGKFIPAKELKRIRFGPTVSTKSIKRFAEKQLAIDKRLNKLFLSPAGRSKFQKVLGLGDDVSFSDMRTLRSSFLKDVRKFARDADTNQGLIKELAQITDQAIFDPKAAQGLSGEALNLLENTNRLYRQSRIGLETTFSEKLVKRLVQNPSDIINEVFVNNNPKAIELLRKSLVEPIKGRPSIEGKILWNQLRQTWLAEAVDEATKTGVAKPTVFNNLLKKLGKESLDEMFPEKETLAGVRKIQTLFERAGKGPPSGMSLFSRGAQVTGAVIMYKSGKEGDFVGFTGGALLAIGPLAFAKLATNPKGVKLLTSGFKMKPGASGLAPIAARMVNLLRDINKTEAKKRQQAIKQGRLQQFARTQPKLPQLRGFRGRGF